MSVRSASARTPLPTRSTGGGVTILVILALLASALASGCGTSVDPDAADGGPRVAIERTLAELTTAIADGEPAAVQTIAPGLGFLADNARSIGVRDLHIVYDGELELGRRDFASDSGARYPESFVALVEFSYALAATPQASTTVEVAAQFAPRGDAWQVLGLGGHATRAPMWLTEPVVAAKGAKWMLVAAASLQSTVVESVARLIGPARRRVDEVLGARSDALVVELPASAQDLGRSLQAPPTEYQSVAGLTTTPDGGIAPGTDVHVYLNPDVFVPLSVRGRRIVLVHEATHALTGSNFAIEMPGWLREGFADYVALRGARVPPRAAAARALARVRDGEMPERLPVLTEFAPTLQGDPEDLSATYELSWLLCLSIVQRYGADSLMELYQESLGGRTIDSALGQVLDVSQSELLSQWQSDLRELGALE